MPPSPERPVEGAGGTGGRAFVIAAVLGTVHALVSLYWALGGNRLLDTLGERITTEFTDRRWLLLPVVVVKLVAALAPLWLDRHGWPARAVTRGLSWLAAAVLLLWGGLNTVVGNLVLGGLVVPSGGYDRPAVVGHAWLWDPLFLLWGLALAAGLYATRRRAVTA